MVYQKAMQNYFITSKEIYISTTNCYSQIIWTKNQLEDYNTHESNIPKLYDNSATMNLANNPIFH